MYKRGVVEKGVGRKGLILRQDNQFFGFRCNLLTLACLKVAKYNSQMKHLMVRDSLHFTVDIVNAAVNCSPDLEFLNVFGFRKTVLMYFRL